MQTKASRTFRRVAERNIKRLYDQDRFLGIRMVGFHVLETLECGHVHDAFPECDPLVALRRSCHVCAQAEGAKVAGGSPLKKPVQSVREPAWRKLGPAA